MTFPSTLETLDTDILWTQKTSARNHSQQHNDVNRILNAVQEKIGINNSLDINSHDWKINHILSQLWYTWGVTTTTYTVWCVFDDPANDLPTNTSVLIDWVVVTDGMLVYVQDCLDTNKIGKIYQATVVWTTISWTYTYTPGVGDVINVTGGTIYWNTTWVVDNTSTIVQYFGGTSGLKAIATTGTIDYSLAVPWYSAYAENDVLLIAPNFTSGTNPNLNINGLGNVVISTTTWLQAGKVYLIAYKSGQRILVAGESGWSPLTDIYNNYLVLTDTMAGTPPEVDIADTRITDTTPYVIFYETQPVGNITRTLTNGNLHIESDDNADTLDVKVVFMGIWPARQYMKWVFAFTGTTHQILDPRITASSAVVAMPRPTPVGYITGSTDVGEINFASTWVEIWVLVDYVIFNDGVAFSDWMAYNATLDDDDIMFRKNSATGVDEAFKVSDLKWSVTSAGTRALVTITKMFNEPSTTTTYTHTLGRVPEYIKMEWICATAGDYTSFGSWITWWTQICVWKGAFEGSFTNPAIAVIAYASWESTIGVISNVTANSFDIIWTHSSSSTPTLWINFLVTLQ